LLEKLKNARTKLPEIKSKIAVFEDEIKNSKVYAPVSGYIQNLQVHNKKEVVAPYDEIMQIVPKSTILVEGKVLPTDIEKVKVGEKAEINFISYVDPSFKVVNGKVIYVSADTIKDKRDPRIEYYKIYVKFTKEGLQAIEKNKIKLIPGMPVVIYVKAGKRTFLSYILYPIKQMIKGAFYAN
jgi:HlyD family type I secretion membrane fusion protein